MTWDISVHQHSAQNDSPVAEQEPLRKTRAEHLRLQLTENGESRVNLTMPVHCAGNLALLMPEKWRGSLDGTGVDLDKISSRAVALEYPPGELFVVALDGKSVRVWLE